MYKLKLHYFVDNYVELERIKRFFAHAHEEDFLFLPALSNTFGSPCAQIIRIAAKRV